LRFFFVYIRKMIIFVENIFKMEKHTVEFYDWFDIQKEICKEMGIEEQYFRDYHKLVGGEYKDLWHIWLEYFQSDVTNDTIVHNDCDERMDYVIEYITEEGDEWAIPFVEAVYRVWDKFEIEYVRYTW
jgi:hypothetical protein